MGVEKKGYFHGATFFSGRGEKNLPRPSLSKTKTSLFFRFQRYEPGTGLPVLGQNDFLPATDIFQQLGKMGFRFENVDVILRTKSVWPEKNFKFSMASEGERF